MPEFGVPYFDERLNCWVVAFQPLAPGTYTLPLIWIPAFGGAAGFWWDQNERSEPVVVVLGP